MWAALIGLAGVVIGAGLKAGYDAWLHKQQVAREDVVWRREHALAAAAAFLEQANRLHILKRNTGQLVEEIVIAREARHMDVVQKASEDLQQVHAESNAAVRTASDALSRLSLLLSQDAYVASSYFLESVLTRPNDPDTTGFAAHLNNLLRADVGLPARVIPPGTGITVDEFRQKIAEMRAAQ